MLLFRHYPIINTIHNATQLFFTPKTKYNFNSKINNPNHCYSNSKLSNRKKLQTKRIYRRNQIRYHHHYYPINIDDDNEQNQHKINDILFNSTTSFYFKQYARNQ